MNMFDGFRFRRVSSPIHDMDPRVKFLYVLVIFAAAVLFDQLLPLLVLFVAQMPLILVAGVKRECMRSMRGSSLFAVIIFATNMLSLYLYSGGGYGSIPSIIERSLAMTFRFMVLVESFSIFFLTTSPDHLGLALEQSGVPFDLCFAFTTAIRFVPVMAEEAQTIIDAQKARGLELERGNFIRRVKNYVPVLIPLLVNSIRRSLELAEAMESRAWGASPKRTNLYVLKMKRSDYYMIITSLIILVLAAYIRLYISIPSIYELLSA
ncbi:hypothetical protein DRO55_02705 [Candidatus Bathyarchaeota archaeon]|nr:MAG: hypothetical protein DRO55_02705 [Candidatus Bathyarchaeota archaeon]